MGSRSDDQTSGVEQTQITQRIIALTYAGSDSVYRNSIKEASEWLRRNYAEHYKVIFLISYLIDFFRYLMSLKRDPILVGLILELLLN
jgi:hypothetical protein